MMKTLVLLVACSPLVHGAGVWNDPSNLDWMDPIERTIQAGDNIIDGFLVGGGQCPEYYTLTVPAGLVITRMELGSYSSMTGESFVGLQPGAILGLAPSLFQRPPLGTPVEDTMIGDFRPRMELVGSRNFLPDLLAESVITETTLGPGDYALWLNETGPGVTFDLNFIAIPVPEPSAPALFFLGAIFSLTRRSR